MSPSQLNQAVTAQQDEITRLTAARDTALAERDEAVRDVEIHRGRALDLDERLEASRELCREAWTDGLALRDENAALRRALGESDPRHGDQLLANGRELMERDAEIERLTRERDEAVRDREAADGEGVAIRKRLAQSRAEIEEALQLDGSCSTLKELVAACLDARAGQARAADALNMLKLWDGMPEAAAIFAKVQWREALPTEGEEKR